MSDPNNTSNYEWNIGLCNIIMVYFDGEDEWNGTYEFRITFPDNHIFFNWSIDDIHKEMGIYPPNCYCIKESNIITYAYTERIAGFECSLCYADFINRNNG